MIYVCDDVLFSHPLHPGIFIDNSLQQGAVMGMEVVVVCRLHAEVVVVVAVGIEVRSLILEVGVLDTLH